MPKEVNRLSPEDAETPSDELDELRLYVRHLERLSDEQADEVAQLHARLAEITHSQGWKLLEVIRGVRRCVFPSGSRRERYARFCRQTPRRAWQCAWCVPAALLRLLTHPRRRAGQLRVLAEPTASHGGGRQFPRVQPQADPGVGTPGLVSVVLPVYNQAELLPAAIESVLNQTYTDFELIVIDDGSTDDVAAVLGRYADHPKVRILTQTNQKLPKALNNAFELAAGEFLTWTSADNLMESAQLERQVKFLRRNPAAAMVYADYLAIDEQGEPLHDPRFRPRNRRPPHSPAIHLPHDPEPLNTMEDNFIGACFLYREWAGRLAGEYTPEMGLEDYDYWMRMNTLVRIAHLDSDECLYRYRVHDNTISGRAGELKIYAGVGRLMTYERTRREAWLTPWTVLADEPTLRWLAQADTTGDTVLSLDKLSSPEYGSSKKLVLLHVDSLPQLSEQRLPAQTCVAVWLGDDRLAPYRYRRELRDLADVCFASEREMAGRVALFNRTVFVAPPGQGMYDLAIAFANRHVFYNATIPPEKRARQLPEPFEAAGRRRRVLLQVGKFVQGGLEQVVLDLAATLTREEFEPLLLVLGRRGGAVAKARQMGLRVLSLPAIERESRYRELLREQRIELVSAHFSPFGAEIARELDIPFVQTLHTSYVFLSPAELAAFRQADTPTSAYICTSGNTALYADVRLGLLVDKMVIAPNGIDPARLELKDRAATRVRLREELGLAADDFVFLSVGSIYRDKAQKMLVTALAEVRREFPRAKLVLLGQAMEDDYLREIKREIERSGLSGAVIFTGFRDEVAPFYAAADAFVLPSFWEGWSLALAEALYLELPIIATDVGSARDVLPPVGAHLVPPVFDTIADVDCGNTDQYVRGVHPRLVADLAAAMKAVCADPTRPALSAEARRTLDRRHAYRAYTRLFRWLLQDGTPAPACVWCG